MDTPHIFNTLDGNLPTSTVLPLPSTTNRNIFPVEWTGTDGYGGAGIATYTIYSSDNFGPWEVWLANTPRMESIFVGECGHRYQFYSVARDQAGNVEATAGVAQASIYSCLIRASAPADHPITNRVIVVGEALTITNRTTDAELDQVAFSLAPWRANWNES